jgi:hypothetical protein
LAVASGRYREAFGVGFHAEAFWRYEDAEGRERKSLQSGSSPAPGANISAMGAR